VIFLVIELLILFMGITLYYDKANIIRKNNRLLALYIIIKMINH
jgi:hypothetical protein